MEFHMDQKLADLSQEVEAALVLGDDLAERARKALGAAGCTSAGEIDLDSTDQVLAAIRDILPGWNIHMKGTASLPNGHWVCSLRQSDIRDNDPFVGTGNGPTLSHALLAALLKALAQSRK
jgi:hypothetical protein